MTDCNKLLGRIQTLCFEDAEKTGYLFGFLVAAINAISEPEDSALWHDFYWHVRQPVLVDLYAIREIESDPKLPPERVGAFLRSWLHKGEPAELQVHRTRILNGMKLPFQQSDLNFPSPVVLDQIESVLNDIEVCYSSTLDADASLQELHRSLAISGAMAWWQNSVHGGGEPYLTSLDLAARAARAIALQTFVARGRKVVDAMIQVGELEPKEYPLGEPIILVTSGITRSLAYLTGNILAQHATELEIQGDAPNALREWSLAFALHREALTSYELEKSEYRLPRDVPSQEINGFELQKVCSTFDRLKTDPKFAFFAFKDAMGMIRPFLKAGWLTEMGELDFAWVSDSEGRKYQWWDYWVRQEAWLEGHISPNVLAQFHKQRGDEEAEDRIKRYFFSVSEASFLSEKAWRALVSVDQATMATSRGRPGIIIDEIQIAVEETFHKAIWEPAARALEHMQSTKNKKAKSLSDLKPLYGINEAAAVIESAKGNPGIQDMRRLASVIGLDALLGRRFTKTDHEWIGSSLSIAMRELQDARNADRHERGYFAEMEEAMAIYKRWMGINGESLLLRLIQIGQRLSTPINGETPSK